MPLSRFSSYSPTLLSHSVALPIGVAALLAFPLLLSLGLFQPLKSSAAAGLSALALSLAAVLLGLVPTVASVFTAGSLFAQASPRSDGAPVVRILALGIAVILLALSALLFLEFGLPPATASLPVIATALILVVDIISSRLIGEVDIAETSTTVALRSTRSLLLQIAAALLAGGLGFVLVAFDVLPDFLGLASGRGTETGLAVGCAILVVLWPHGIGYLNARHHAALKDLARRQGFLLPDANSLTQLPHLGAVVFDRSALMADTRLVVTDVKAFDDQPHILVSIAASAEAYANHPIGLAIRDLARDWNVPQEQPEEHEEAEGLGIVAMIGGEAVAVGNTGLMDQLKVDSFTATSLCRSYESAGKVCVLVAVGQRVVGILALQGNLHPQAQDAVSRLRKVGCASLIVSGTSAATTRWHGEAVGAEGFRHGIAPQDRASAAATAVGHLNALFVYRPKRAPDSLLICLLQRGSDRLIQPLAQALEASPNAIPGLLVLGAEQRLKASRRARINLATAIALAVPAFFGLLPLALTGFTAILPLAFAAFNPSGMKRLFSGGKTLHDHASLPADRGGAA